MRYVIYGAGAVGGIIGGRLFQQGQEVLLIARGEHLSAIRERGLQLVSPRGSDLLRVDAVGHPSEVRWHEDDAVVLAMKTQDTAAALDSLRAAAGDIEPALFCSQNGVENERLAARWFERVYGVMVFMPATFLEPGAVQSNGSPVDGILYIGRYPRGSDEPARRVAEDMNASGIRAHVEDEIMRWKYAKLLTNLGNGLQAACGLDAGAGDLYRALHDEALACYRASGIEWASPEEMRESRGDFRLAPAGDQRRAGGSSWQSLARGAGTIETDFLNGEIALLGATYGVPAPANRLVQRVANELARDAKPPGSVSVDDLRLRLAQQTEVVG